MFENADYAIPTADVPDSLPVTRNQTTLFIRDDAQAIGYSFSLEGDALEDIIPGFHDLPEEVRHDIFQSFHALQTKFVPDAMAMAYVDVMYYHRGEDEDEPVGEVTYP